MKMPAYRQILLASLCTASFTIHAAPGTWRCGNTYTDQPCEGGRPVTMDDRCDTRQQRDADADARRAQYASDRMAQERLRLERSTAGRQAVLITKPPEAVAPGMPAEPKTKARARKQRAAADHFTAQGPGTGVKKKAEGATSSGKP